MAGKRYYWLKLNEDYLISPKIKKLRKIAGGDTFTIIYLKMQLISVSNEGIIEFENIESSFEEELALKLDEDLENVKITLQYLKQQELIECNNNEYFIIEASNKIGSESESAERVRKFREKTNYKALQCNGSVTEVKRNSLSISNSNNIYNIDDDCKVIIDYLNAVCKTKFGCVESNYRFIRGRLKDYKVEDLKKVIDRQYKNWNKTKWQKYLRPETLFNATKFETYLNGNDEIKENSASGKNAVDGGDYNGIDLSGLFSELK